MTTKKNNQDIELQILSVLKKQTRYNESIEQNIYRLIINAENHEIIGGSPISSSGTGFTILGENGGYYLVTAAHLFKGIHVKDIPDSLSIQYMDEPKKVEVEDFKIGQYGYGEGDVAVFRIDISSLRNKFDSKLEIEMYNRNEYIHVGDQIIFVGYPSLKGEIKYREKEFDKERQTGFPKPFLKFGYLSYYTDNPIRFYVDGAPNFGFSGGPVMFMTDNNELRYIGIVSRGTDDGGIGGLTMVCEPIHIVAEFIDELESRIKK